MTTQTETIESPEAETDAAYIGTATYSPEDNKLRIYPRHRLDAETYARVKAAGFSWAPKQELFVAPMWTPRRFDLAQELCGEVGDEDTSLVDRAEERAERFGDYSDKRRADSESAHKAVRAIADNIPFGQPILIGHHSERHARKDAERIRNGMTKAVKMWETSTYWTQRAAGALAHAKYKELPAVRARRIKGIETDKRRCEKNKKSALAHLAVWQSDKLNHALALQVANYSTLSFKFPLDKYPRNPPVSQYEGDMGIWGALDHGIITYEQARDLVVPTYQRGIAHNDRWIEHFDNRLAYERAMLDAAGASDLLKPKARPELLPLLNYRAPDGVIVAANMYHRGETVTYPQVDMTKAEYAKIYSDYKGGCKSLDKSHRFRIAIIQHKRVAVFLTDSKVHPIPAPVDAAGVPAPIQPDPEAVRKAEERLAAARAPKPEPDPQAAEIDAMRASLKAGVQVVAAPQLFPTPDDLARRMVEIAGVSPGERVLEPSAGTGALLRRVWGAFTGADCGRVVAVEINHSLAEQLRQDRDMRVGANESNVDIRCADFLDLSPDDLGTFHRVVMNPPFANGADIKHIEHARRFLKPGGRLVAICANGPRQQAALKSLADEWHDLPAGTFADQGTNVSTALVVFDAPSGATAKQEG